MSPSSGGRRSHRRSCAGTAESHRLWRNGPAAAALRPEPWPSEDELLEKYSHASGPGGQGVNTADSRVQLSFDVAASTVLDAGQRERVLTRLRSRLAGTVLAVDAAEFRSQHRNRVAARERLAELLRDALAPPPPPRRPTRPTRGSIDRRLNTKRRRGDLKRNRSRPGED